MATSAGTAVVVAFALAAIAIYVSVVSTRNSTCGYCPVLYDSSTKQVTLASDVKTLWVTDGTDTSATPTTPGVVVGSVVPVSLPGGYTLSKVSSGIVQLSHNDTTVLNLFGAAVVAGRLNPTIRTAIDTYKQGLYLGGQAPNSIYGTGNTLWSIHSQTIEYSDPQQVVLGEWVSGAGEQGYRVRMLNVTGDGYASGNEYVLTANRLFSGPTVTASAITNNPGANVYDKQVAVQRLTNDALPECLSIPVNGEIKLRALLVGGDSKIGSYRYRDVLVDRKFDPASGECIALNSSLSYLYSYASPAISITPLSMKLSACPDIGTTSIPFSYYSTADCSDPSYTSALTLGSPLADGTLLFECGSRT